MDSGGNLATARNQAVSGTITLRGMGGTSGGAEAKFTLAALPRGSSNRTITITAASFAKLAPTNEVEWGKSPDSSHQNMFIAGLAEGTKVSASNTAVVPKSPVGSITVVKRDAANDRALSGCVFGLKKWDGSAYVDTGTTKTTGSDGKDTFTNLTTDAASGGKYHVYEKTAPAGYEPDSSFYLNFVVGSGWYKYRSSLVSELTNTLSGGGSVNRSIIKGDRPDTLRDFTVWQDDQNNAEHHLTVRKLITVENEQWPWVTAEGAIYRAAETAVQIRVQDRKQFRAYHAVLGKEMPRSVDAFQKMKYTEPEKWDLVKLDYSRRTALAKHPALKLPNAERATAAEDKFTKYLFNEENEKGIAKGRAFAEQLGYNGSNWQGLRRKKLEGAEKHPATPKQSDQYGTRYQQQMILYGDRGQPANVVVGWNVRPDGTVTMTTAFVKKVKKS